MFVSFGIAFEVPVVVVLLTALRVVSVETLRAGRGYAVLIIAIASALLTVTGDAVSMLTMAVPMLILYEAGILASRFLQRLRVDSISRRGI